MNNYQRCVNCVVDNQYNYQIKFDKFGICSYCQNFKNKISPILVKNKSISKKLNNDLVKKIKKNKNSNYDCIIGVSGGVDSSYLVYHTVRNLRLKPILLHVDTGWNNSIAVSNIEKLVNVYDLDLYTEVIDWNEMKDLCRSFLFAQVPYMESIQDHAIWASTHKFAKKKNIKNILTGGNLQTECYRPPLYIAYFSGDVTLIKNIHKKFGTIKLKKFPLLDIFEYKIIYPMLYGIKLYQPLNYIDYNKARAIEILKSECEWTNYGDKHHESNFTKFFDGYWKPKKFGHDARVGQLSSLIATNQISRHEAIELLKSNYYSNIENVNRDFNYISRKLDINIDDLNNIFLGSNKFYYNYKSKIKILKLITKVITNLKIENRNIS